MRTLTVSTTESPIISLVTGGMYLYLLSLIPFADHSLRDFAHNGCIFGYPDAQSQLPSHSRCSPNCQEFLRHSRPPNLHSSPIVGRLRCLKVSRERAAATLITALLTQSQTVQNSSRMVLNIDRNRPPRVYLMTTVSLPHYAETCRPC